MLSTIGGFLFVGGLVGAFTLLRSLAAGKAVPRQQTPGAPPRWSGSAVRPRRTRIRRSRRPWSDCYDFDGFQFDEKTQGM